MAVSNVPAATAFIAPRPQATAVNADDNHAKARAVARDFEAVFLNAMLQPMFTGLDDNGPFGGGPGAGIWRSMLTDQYAQSLCRLRRHRHCRSGLPIPDCGPGA